MTDIMQIRLANYFIFLDASHTILVLRSKSDIQHINSDWMRVSIADDIVRVVNPRLDPIAKNMQLIKEYSSDLHIFLLRLLARTEVRDFFGGLADTSHLSGCLCAVVERSAILRCVDKGFYTHRHLWSNSFIKQSTCVWFQRYGQYSEARIYNHDFFTIMLHSIDQVHGIVDEFFVVLA